jgi:hypothetical protein
LRRRYFVTLLGGAAVVWPLAVRAQQTRKVPRIGILDFFPSAASADFIEPFQQGLRELGYVDGGNIHVEYHSAEQRSDLAATLAADLVRREVDIIVCRSDARSPRRQERNGNHPDRHVGRGPVGNRAGCKPRAAGREPHWSLGQRPRSGGQATGVAPGTSPGSCPGRLSRRRQRSQHAHLPQRDTSGRRLDPRAPAAAARGGTWGIRRRLRHYDQGTSASADCAAALRRAPWPSSPSSRRDIACR